MTVTLGILLAALVTATWTDVSRRKIYNWTTYPGMLGCLVAAYWEAGANGFVESLVGGLICGGLMFVCYLCLDVGGGDVKLAALMGTGLGWAYGLYALLWTFTLAGALAAAAIIWRLGAGRIFKRLLVRLTGRKNPEDDQTFQNELRRPLFLAPAALVAVLIVTAPVLSPSRGVDQNSERVPTR